MLYGLQHGNRVLQEIHKEMSLDRVEKILDDSADAVAHQNVFSLISPFMESLTQQELSNMLGERISNADEDDVLAEFNQLEQQMVCAALLLGVTDLDRISICRQYPTPFLHRMYQRMPHI